MDQSADTRPHVVIVGGGFAGLSCAQKLRKARVRITIIDRSNHHLFQPLLYQVAMAGLSPADIASPIRSVVSKQKNTSVLLAEVVDVDLERQVISLAKSEIPFHEMPYDYLILATGVRTGYFGNDQWATIAPGLKSVDDALEIRRRVLLAYEAAERELDSERRRRLMTFVVVGGGPTGVELAGSLVELSRHVLGGDFREISSEAARVILIEGNDTVLRSFAPQLSQKALEQLKRMGVEVRTGTLVSDITERGVHLGEEFIPAATVLWAAGISGSPLAKTLGVPLTRGGQIIVEPDLSVPGYPNVFALGDMASFSHQTGDPLPGIAPVALQQGRYLGKALQRSLAGKEPGTFSYFDKGTMATIGRKAAIVQTGRLRLTGFVAWLAWLFIHILYLVGFRNRAVVLTTWAWSYFTYGRGARLITGGRMNAGAPESEDDDSSVET